METTQSPKGEARELLDSLPDDASWQEVAYHMVVRWEIEQGMADSEAGRATPVEEVMREFGIQRSE
ncbi:MAG: hypothetical protein ACQERG_09030 [Pseudomonadota bacterium]